MQPQVATRTKFSPQPATIELQVFLPEFAERHGRSLQPRGRRTVNELLELLTEYLEDRGVSTVARSGRRGVTSLAELFDWLDAFEAGEMVEVFGDSREAMRVADTAMRALTRDLQRSLR